MRTVDISRTARTLGSLTGAAEMFVARITNSVLARVFTLTLALVSGA
jgi:hypothetical protein